MKLSDEQIRQVMNHFTAKTGHYKCPMCGGQSGGVEPKVYMAPESSP